MDKKTTLAIEDLELDQDGPTEIPLANLFTWVIWQLPRQRKEGMVGAVRPPTGDYGWFPAMINRKKQTVLIHGHVERPFDSPETAVEYFN